jgi:monovalent cation:H+ antiporter-2, CPA2 family
LLVAATLIIGKWLVPKVLVSVAKTRARDVFTLTVLVLALGVAVGSAKVFGVSMALGAFLAGLVVGQSQFGARAAAEAIPMRDAFAVLFFVSVGMQLDPMSLGQSVPIALVTIFVAGVVKPLTAYVATRGLGMPKRSAAPLAATLAQVGEFSFIVAALGRSLGVLSVEATQGIVLASIVMITLNPFVYRAARKVRQAATVSSGSPEDEGARPGEIQPDRAVVIGYGPVGRTVTQLLRDNGITPSVVELNHDLAGDATKAGVRAICGDASHRHTLEVAGVQNAATLIFAASGTPPLPIVEMVKDLNPKIRILARAPYVRDAAAVRGAGADVVVVGEAEVAFAMTALLLERLGATAEQIDRARDRVRQDLG